eukprot:397434-Hanusia_phi.AAC.2
MANVDVSQISVVSVREISLRRGDRVGRALLAVGVEVETAILTSSTEKDALIQSVNQAALDRELVKNGLPKSFALVVSSGTAAIHAMVNRSALVSLVALPLGILLVFTGCRVFRLYKRQEGTNKVVPVDTEGEDEDAMERSSWSDSEQPLAIEHSAGTTGNALMDELETFAAEEEPSGMDLVLAYSEPDLRSTVIGKHRRDVPVIEHDMHMDGSNRLWILHEAGWSLSRDLVSRHNRISPHVPKLRALPRKPARLLPIAQRGHVHAPPWERQLRLSPTASLFLSKTAQDDQRGQGPLTGGTLQEEATSLPGTIHGSFIDMVSSHEGREEEVQDSYEDIALMTIGFSSGTRKLKKLPRGFRH